VTIEGREKQDIDAKLFFEGMALNISQVFLLGDWWVGVIVFVGTLFASRITAMMLLVGSVASSVFALGMGVDPSLIYAGLIGYNGVVVAAAIGGMFWALSPRTFCFAFIGVIQSVVLQVAFGSLLSPVGLPTLTFPAALVCTIWTLINPVLHDSDSFFVTLDHMTIPEDHLRRLNVTHKIAGIMFSDQRTIAGSSKEMSEFETSIVPAVVCYYVAEGKLDTLKSWVESGVIDVNKSDFDGRTPLHIAASIGQEIVAQYLVDSGANVNARDRYGNTPLEDAVRENHLSLIKIIRDRGGKLMRPRENLGAKMCEHSHENESDALFSLLLAGVSPNTPDYDNRTALHLSVCSQNAPITKRLLLSGATPNAPCDCCNRTPLQEAFELVDGHKGTGGQEKKRVLQLLQTPTSELKNEDVVRGETQAFLQLGNINLKGGQGEEDGEEWVGLVGGAGGTGEEREVDVEVSDDDIMGDVGGKWRTGLHGDKEFFTRLALSSKKPSNFEEEAFQTLLINYVAACGFVEPLRILLARRGGLPLDYDKRTPLHVGAASGHENVVRFLIYYGFPVNPVDLWRHTPLLDAIISGHDGVASLLYSLGGKILLSPSEQVHDLVNCVTAQDSVGFELRLKYGFNPNSVDYDGRTALHCIVTRNVGRMWIDGLLGKGARVDIPDRWGVTAGELMGESKNNNNNNNTFNNNFNNNNSFNNNPVDGVEEEEVSVVI